LSSRVAAVRRAIGDNGDDQRLIRTHHKRGFRFVGWPPCARSLQARSGHPVHSPDAAVMHLCKSVELNHNFALGYAGLGYAFACSGQPERGLKSLEQAQRLSPRDPFLAMYAPVVRYMALFAMGQYEETIAVCRATTAMHPNHAGAWRLLTVSLGLLGRI